MVLGLQGAQMPANAVRGIGRWANEFVLALCRTRPDLVAAVSIDPTLTLPRAVFDLPLDVPVLTTDQRPPDGPGPVVFHALSLLEDLALSRVWPAWARRPEVGLVATLYDMIPALFPADHFRGPLRRLLESRYEIIRQAGAVMAISATTAADAHRLLDIPRDRLSVVHGAVAPAFRPAPGPPDDLLADVPSALGIRPDFLLSVGNVDPRKNLTRLLRAYATLPPGLRGRHQLVVTCSQAGDAHVHQLAEQAAALGIGDEVVLARSVDDPTMVRLYQTCRALVFPSLYEGLGLPLIEALRCGAVTLASDVGSFREIVRNPEARFDPTDVPAIGACLRRVLTDPAFVARRRAAAPAEGRRFDWGLSLVGALTAYRGAAR